MCIQIYAPGKYLEIPLLHEDIYPTWKGKGIHVFTFLLENCSRDQCGEIYFLYPNSNFADEVEIHGWHEGKTEIKDEIQKRAKDATLEFARGIERKDSHHNWHYLDPIKKNGEISIRVRNYVPGPETWREYSGKIAEGKLNLVQDTQSFTVNESLTLLQIGYSVFVYRFDPPISPYHRCWLRFVLRPAICAHEVDTNLGLLRYFREEMFIPCRILSPSQVRERFKELISKVKQGGTPEAHDGTFGLESKIINRGFDEKGTITRIRDWRISLLGNINGVLKRIRIDNINIDPDPVTKPPSIISVPRRFKEPGRTERFLYRYRNPAYDHLEWLTGYGYNWKSDSLEIAKKLCKYLYEYGNCIAAAKSKFEIGRALEDLPHDFCSWLVDNLKDIGVLSVIPKNGHTDELYYVEKTFPEFGEFANNLMRKILSDTNLVKELLRKWAEPVFVIHYIVRWRNILYPVLSWLSFFIAIGALVLTIINS